jgi:hypothetical protein
LYYRSLQENLDALADSLKRAGRLGGGKVRFNIVIDDWNPSDRQAVVVTRAKDGYHCGLNKYYTAAGQDYLTKIVMYFASDGWRPFTYDAYGEPAQHRKALKTFNGRLDSVEVSHVYPPRKVMDVGNGAAVYYENDTLICRDAGRSYGAIKWLLPFSVGSRVFVVVGETVYAVEGGEVINQIKLKADDFDCGCDGGPPPFKDVFTEWVNFKAGDDVAFLSYSIPKNKFYRVKRE